STASWSDSPSWPAGSSPWPPPGPAPSDAPDWTPYTYRRSSRRGTAARHTQPRNGRHPATGPPTPPGDPQNEAAPSPHPTPSPDNSRSPPKTGGYDDYSRSLLARRSQESSREVIRLEWGHHDARWVSTLPRGGFLADEPTTNLG